MRVKTKRMVLGGAMHGQRVTVLRGSTMKSAASGDIYKRYDLDWWVPYEDTDDQAAERVRAFKATAKSETL